MLQFLNAIGLHARIKTSAVAKLKFRNAACSSSDFAQIGTGLSADVVVREGRSANKYVERFVEKLQTEHWTLPEAFTLSVLWHFGQKGHTIVAVKSPLRVTAVGCH